MAQIRLVVFKKNTP